LDSVKADESFIVKITLGKEIPHPNTTEHHIRWISVYFQPEDEKFTSQIEHFEFCAHGESAKGANQGFVYTNHEVSFSLKVSKPGVIYATALCNIHGLWQSQKGASGFLESNHSLLCNNILFQREFNDKRGLL